MSKIISINTWVDVEVDLEEIESKDLIEELKSRNLGDQVSGEDIGEDITEMFYAFRLGRLDRAVELAKKIACDHTGRIL